MENKYWETEEFKKQQEKWYKKIANKGFEDIEILVGNKQVLKQRSSNVYKQASQIERDNKLLYFELLQEFCNKFIFEDKTHQTIMNLRSNGITINEIATQVSKHRQTVRYIIRKYEVKWKIKRFSNHELNPSWRTGE